MSLIDKLPTSVVPEIQELRNEMKPFLENKDFYIIYVSKLNGTREKIVKRFIGYKDVFENSFKASEVCYHDQFESPLIAIMKLKDRIENSYRAILARRETVQSSFKQIQQMLNPILTAHPNDVEKEFAKIPYDVMKIGNEYYAGPVVFGFGKSGPHHPRSDIRNHLFEQTIRDMCQHRELEMLKSMITLLNKLKVVIVRVVQKRKEKLLNNQDFRQALDYANRSYYVNDGRIYDKLHAKMAIGTTKDIPFPVWWINDMLNVINKHGFNIWT